MKLVTFLYDKQNGDPVRRRVVARKSGDYTYLYGIDLEDHNGKTFLKSRISDYKEYDDYSESVLANSKVYTYNDLFTLLGYGEAEKRIVKELSPPIRVLIDAVKNKTGHEVTSLGNDLFIELGNNQMSITLPSVGLTINVRENELKFYDKTRELTLQEFTRKVLGVSQ